MDRVLIVGTGLIGASLGLALKRAGFAGEIAGSDRSAAEAAEALRLGALDRVIAAEAAELQGFDVVVLCVPVLGVLDWMERLAPVLGPDQLVTDVGSTKRVIAEAGIRLFGRDGRAEFLPGHPMAGKESGGAALADGALFDGAMWLFTPVAEGEATADPSALLREDRERALRDDREKASALAAEWRGWVERIGCRTMDLEAAHHDRVCAWVSHLPQMVSTAMAAMLADEFALEPELAEEFAGIGGRAMREMTRLGASPYSMWRDVALTNTENVAATLMALEQRLAHMRENLKTPELRDEFAKANGFRGRVES